MIFRDEDAAEAWCKAEGLTVGTMAGGDPRGLKRGADTIGKWHNLDEDDRAQLDGVLELLGKWNERDAPARVTLYA